MNILNMTIEIADSRKFFWQWDTGCKLRLIGSAEGHQVHFYRDGMTEPLPVPVYARGEDVVCDIPDEILQIAKTFAVYTYMIGEDGKKTYISRTFVVEGRPKPVDYIYTPTEKYTVEKAVEEAIKKLIDGEFDLDTEAILEVEELPTEDINSALLYRTAEGVYWYDGEWHKVVDESNLPKQEEIVFDGEYNAESNKAATVETVIRKVAEIVANAPEDFNTLKELSDWLITHGAEAAEMNSAIKANTDDIAEINEGLTSYVKYTDYAGNVIAGEKPGVIGLNYAASCGLRFESSGNRKFLKISDPDTVAISRRNGVYALVIGMLDTYIKYGITGQRAKNVNGQWIESYGNQIPLTDTEKSSAAKWLGVPNAYEVDNPDLAVDIPFTYGSAISINPDEIAYLVSDKTFTKEELLSSGFPFYFEVQNASSGIKQTFGLAEAVIEEGNGYVKIQKLIDDCGVTAYVVYDNTAGFVGEGGTYPPSNGIYFVSCSYHNYRFERLYRDGKGIKTIDNKYLDLANHPVIKDILARLN